MAEMFGKDWEKEMLSHYGNQKIPVPKGGLSLENSLEELMNAVSGIVPKPVLEKAAQQALNAPAKLYLDMAAKRGVKVPEFIVKLITSGKIATLQELAEFAETLPKNLQTAIPQIPGQNQASNQLSPQAQAAVQAMVVDEEKFALALNDFCLKNNRDPFDVVKAIVSQFFSMDVSNSVTKDPQGTAKKYLSACRKILDYVTTLPELKGTDEKFTALLFSFSLLDSIVEKKPFALIGSSALGGAPTNSQEYQIKSALDDLLKSIGDQS